MCLSSGGRRPRVSRAVDGARASLDRRMAPESLSTGGCARASTDAPARSRGAAATPSRRDPRDDRLPAQVVDVALSPGTPFAARGADAGPPTAPLQVFAQIPSETLEAFFDSEGKADAAPGSVERAEATYAALAERLAKCANAPGGGV